MDLYHLYLSKTLNFFLLFIFKYSFFDSNKDIDKELLFTPTINYGGGVDASQRFEADYAQLISGGNIIFDLSTDTNFENQNNENWIRDASLITNIDKKINEKFKLSFDSALQTSQTYLRRTDENNIVNITIKIH